MSNCCISCHRQMDEIDPFTGLCYECMEWCVDNFPEYDDEYDNEAEV